MPRRRLIHRIMLCIAIAMFAIGLVELFIATRRVEGAVVIVVAVMVGLTASRALKTG